ncbi:MAG: hypothetical protein HC893_01695 [Chloroflexaceae bacterium]|nr:hypothetical protein [Chloroflexaceae bacterium]
MVPVWDVGPWNTDDSYWQSDRGDYPDLPVGLPQAEAAYYYGHNGGRDEFGRIITNPNGIDIADGTFWDDLGLSNNDWVDVSFLWLGADPGPGDAIDIAGPAPEQDNPPAPAAPAPPQEPPAATPIPLDSPVIPTGASSYDNSDSGFSTQGDGWQSHPCGVNGDHLWFNTAAGSSARATWTPNLATGTYEVRAYIPPCGEVAAVSAAAYIISHDGGTEQIEVNQADSEGVWVSLGSYSFGRRTSAQIRLSPIAGASGQAIRADALAWVPIEDTAAPVARVVNITREAMGYRVEWGGEDDLSGIATYDVEVRQLPRGLWRLWIDQQDLTSAWFGPDEGKHFAFRVRAATMLAMSRYGRKTM